MSASSQLAELARSAGALRTGDFILRSGRKTGAYLDAITLALHPDAAPIIGRELVRRAREQGANVIAGPALGAAPMVAAAVAMSRQEGYPLRGALLREDWKAHGVTGIIAGRLEPDDRVLLVDDVTTTGESLRAARETIEQVSGAAVAGAAVICDRSGTVRDPLIGPGTLPELEETGAG